jgi:uncharacterized protein YggE
VNNLLDEKEKIGYHSLVERYIRHPAGVVLFFFILLFLYTKVVGPIPFTVNNINTIKDSPFSVQGQGSASAAPDQATISFGVTKNAATVASAQEQTNSAINSILEGLKDLGASNKDIKTTNYSVNPNYNFDTGGQRITGYNVTQNIDLKLKDIKNVNRAIDVITGNGANLVGQIQFGFSDKTKKDLEETARKEAVGNAKQKAQNIAKVSGVRLGKIVNVQEVEDESLPRPLPVELDRKIGGTEPVTPPTEITPGENSVKVNIILTYEIN